MFSFVMGNMMLDLHISLKLYDKFPYILIEQMWDKCKINQYDIYMLWHLGWQVTQLEIPVN